MLKTILAVGLLLIVAYPVSAKTQKPPPLPAHKPPVIVIVISQPPPPSGGEDRQQIETRPTASEQPAAADERGTVDHPVVVDIKPAPKDETKEAADRAERDEKATVDWRSMFYTGLVALFTLFLFVAAAVQVVLFIWQLRLIKDSAEQAKTAANAAKASADFIPIAERAYVAAVPRGVRPYHSAGNPADENIACDVGLKNVGHLAARSVAYAVRFKFCADPKLDKFTPLAGQCEGNVALAPGMEMVKGASPPVDRAVFENGRSAADGSSKWLYVFGRVEYIDGFHKRRWVEFCFRYSMAAARGGFSISEDDARYHEYGNNTDEDEESPGLSAPS